jgi:Subtilisin inhibitor-like
MRELALLALALVGLVSASAAGAGTASRTSLTITFWEDGSKTSEKTVWTLRCNPAGGTLKRPAVACSRIATAGWNLFAPVKHGMICTQIYGGPQAALVVGTVQGRRVWAKFQRRNGCEISRWNRVSPWLLPPGGVT